MKNIISRRTAGRLLIASLLVLLLFHLLVALRALPADIVWGGTLDETSVMVYEIAAMAITSILLFFSVVTAGYITNPLLQKIAGVFIWLMVVYFAVMILANAAAKTVTERVVFIPLSLLMFICSLRLAIEKGPAE